MHSRTINRTMPHFLTSFFAASLLLTACDGDDEENSDGQEIELTGLITANCPPVVELLIDFARADGRGFTYPVPCNQDIALITPSLPLGDYLVRVRGHDADGGSICQSGTVALSLNTPGQLKDLNIIDVCELF